MAAGSEEDERGSESRTHTSVDVVCLFGWVFIAVKMIYIFVSFLLLSFTFDLFFSYRSCPRIYYCLDGWIQLDTSLNH